MILIFFSTIFGLAIFFTWRRYREQAITLLEFFGWSAMWALGIFLIWRPETTNVLANLVGVGRGADLVVYLSVIVLFWLVFKIYVRLESFEQKLTTFVRDQALREFSEELEETKKIVEDAGAVER